MASAELILGVAVIIVAAWFLWAARPSATGPVRRLASLPLIEPYFIVFIMALILAAAILIALATGAV